ncbi:DUF4304 domain-containing protein [Streptomyces albidoflavus]
MINSVLLEAFNEVFKSLGFRKKSANWYRVSGDLYCIVGVQESRWDESCYVNVGFPEKRRRRVERMTFGWASSRRLQIQRRGRSIRLRICRI